MSGLRRSHMDLVAGMSCCRRACFGRHDQGIDRHDYRVDGLQIFAANDAAINTDARASGIFDLAYVRYEKFGARHFQHRKSFFRAFPFHHFRYSPYPAASLVGECYRSNLTNRNKTKCHKSFTKFHVAFFNKGVMQPLRGCVCNASSHASNRRLYLSAQSSARTLLRLRLKSDHSNQSRGSSAFRRSRLSGARALCVASTETIRSIASLSSAFNRSSLRADPFCPCAALAAGGSHSPTPAALSQSSRRGARQ